MTARKRRSAGWLSGVVAGVIYVLLMICVGFLTIGNMAFSADTAKMMLLMVLGSVLGGIFGVNTKKRR